MKAHELIEQYNAGVRDFRESDLSGSNLRGRWTAVLDTTWNKTK